jgi:hypothetical protein
MEKLDNDELHILYSSPNSIRHIKSRRMRWVGHVARIGRGEYTGFWWESQKERAHLEGEGIDGRMGSEWNLGRLAGGAQSGSRWLRIWTGGGLL